MAKQEITLKGLDGQEDHLVYDAANGQIGDSLEECARSLFPQEGETTPRLRFQGFEGEWERKLLSDCIEISDEKNTDNLYGIEDVLSVSDDSGVVNQIELLGRSYAGKSVSGYKILRPGQIVYTKSPLRQKPYGIVKVNRGKTGIVSVLYAVYNVKDGISAEYLHYYFDPAWRLNAYMRPLVNKGAKNTMNISDETALTGYIMIPKDKEEQERIASFLRRIDSQISLHHQQFERLRELKSACLGSMFPRESEIAPPIRFKGFEKEWETVSFKDISYLSGTKNRDNMPLPSYSVSNEFGLIPQDEQFEHGGTMTYADKRMYYIVSPDSFVYNPARINVGSIGYDDLDIDVIVSSLYVVFKTDEKTDNHFLNYWFKTPTFKKMIELYQEGGVRQYFFYDKLCSCSFRRPSLNEQRRIASFFQGLDSHITTEQQRLDQLKQMKSACLRSMFPQNGGGNFPLIRFKEFDEEWTLYSLSQILKVNSGMDYKKLNSGSIPVYGTGGYMLSVDKSISDRDAIGIGRKGTIDVPQLLRSPFWTIDTLFFMTLKNDFDLEFVYALCQTINWKAHDESTGVPSLSKNNIEKIEVYVPKIEEQRRIASFFRSLDTKITLQTQRIEKLKQMKSACLSKMIA